MHVCVGLVLHVLGQWFGVLLCAVEPPPPLRLLEALRTALPELRQSMHHLAAVLHIVYCAAVCMGVFSADGSSGVCSLVLGGCVLWDVRAVLQICGVVCLVECAALRCVG